ncbi:MAG TPA: EAL domain-containing protein, partial [Epsilonproteobacteria bacterium]|nr:EAL domain-containing protein [Campylobacterota bacterium]
WTKILQEEKWTGKVYITRADKVEFPIWLSVNSVKDKRGEVINYIAIYTDLTEVIRTQEKADFLAYHDSLTLLPNRAYYEQYMVKLTDEMMGKSHKTAIMFLDLDRFKVINDTLGHATGDELLKLSAERISKVLSGDTFFARLGGDEFVIILHDVQSREQVKHLVEKILKVVRVPMFVSQHQLTISVSIGISIYPDDSMEANILTKYADSAMYSAKENGKDTYAFYERQLTIDIHSRLNLEQKLSGALKEHEFSLVYHPLYDLTSHRVLGVETLLRWKNSALGAVSPDEFIPVAEDTGLIIEIGYYVLEEACRTFVSWKDKGVALEYISVNISSVQLRQKNFLQKMAKIITKTNILPSEIEIELTESILFEYSGSKINVLQKLSEMGCRISIDDFGTGYSSMSYLKDLPVDTVKIDQTFVRHLVDNEHDQKVVKAIIALSKSLGYKVIAEGIESFEQEIFLKTDHCDYGQGYYFSEPLDSSRLIAFIQERENI